MIFKSRRHIFGVTEEGGKEFIHTTLSGPSAVSFMKRHKQLFGNRYSAYFYKTMCDDAKEHYLK